MCWCVSISWELTRLISADKLICCCLTIIQCQCRASLTVESFTKYIFRNHVMFDAQRGKLKANKKLNPNLHSGWCLLHRTDIVQVGGGKQQYRDQVRLSIFSIREDSKWGKSRHLQTCRSGWLILLGSIPPSDNWVTTWPIWKVLWSPQENQLTIRANFLD